jgi:hypothetical protein
MRRLMSLLRALNKENACSINIMHISDAALSADAISRRKVTQKRDVNSLLNHCTR